LARFRHDADLSPPELKKKSTVLVEGYAEAKRVADLPVSGTTPESRHAVPWQATVSELLADEGTKYSFSIVTSAKRGR
jgi:hypothetical protein